jgi:phage FluMu protein Com
MSTMGMENIKCPFCGNKFSYWVEYSSYTAGVNLDFKPYGAVSVPTPLPKCPKCKFVFFDKLFSKKEVASIKDMYKNKTIIEEQPNMPDYYYLAKECELVNKDIETLIFFYHAAIWETDSKILFKKFSNIILKFIETISIENEKYYIYQLIKLDFLRRQKKFDKADKLINHLLWEQEFPVEYDDVLYYQEELIFDGDTEEHEMPKKDDKSENI